MGWLFILLQHLVGEQGESRGWEMRMGAGWEGDLDEILLICAERRVSAKQRQDES